MSDNSIYTLHAPGERCDSVDLEKQVEKFNDASGFKQAYDATNSMILVLNSCRQAVFASKAFLKMVKIEEISTIFGKRPGEILKCIHASKEINGCGTAEACQYCNAVNAILQAMEKHGEYTSDFSNINCLHGTEGNLNAVIHVVPLEVHGEMFYVLSFIDNNDAVQKKILERTFFHDIINTAGALKGIIGLLKEEVPPLIKPEVEFVEVSIGYLIEEIQMQKNLLAAENNELSVALHRIDSYEILKDACKLYEGHEVAKNKEIKIADSTISKQVCVDGKLLRRILGNMIKNALEATEERGSIIAGCTMVGEKEEYTKFWVHSSKYMDKRAQNLIFHRSFSTKGEGRGLGTYSMKLIGEKYLKGKVGFITSESAGTTFHIIIPCKGS